MQNQEYHTAWAKNLEDSTLHTFWDRLCACGVAQMTFYDYFPESAEDFCAWAKQKCHDVRLIYRLSRCHEHLDHTANKPCEDHALRATQQRTYLAMYWLNNPLGKTVMIHFCFLKEAFAEQIAVGEYVTNGLLNTKAGDGEYVLNALIGLTPKPYRHAIRYIEKLGFCLLTTLPGSCFFRRKNTHKDAVLSVLKRENLRQRVHSTQYNT